MFAAWHVCTCLAAVASANADEYMLPSYFRSEMDSLNNRFSYTLSYNKDGNYSDSFGRMAKQLSGIWDEYADKAKSLIDSYDAAFSSGKINADDFLMYNKACSSQIDTLAYLDKLFYEALWENPYDMRFVIECRGNGEARCGGDNVYGAVRDSTITLHQLYSKGYLIVCWELSDYLYPGQEVDLVEQWEKWAGEGTYMTVTLLPDDGYEIESIAVDGKEMSDFLPDGWSLGLNVDYKTTMTVCFRKKQEKCPPPSITFSEGKLHFECEVPDAQYHYTISDDDVCNDAVCDDGSVSLTARLDISAYAIADGYKQSDTATATLYWLPEGKETSINTLQHRGIVASLKDGIITLSGLSVGEEISFYSPSGMLLGQTRSAGNMCTYAVSSAETVVIAKIGNYSITIGQ